MPKSKTKLKSYFKHEGIIKHWWPPTMWIYLMGMITNIVLVIYLIVMLGKNEGNESKWLAPVFSFFTNFVIIHIYTKTATCCHHSKCYFLSYFHLLFPLLWIVGIYLGLLGVWIPFFLNMPDSSDTTKSPS